MSCYAAVGSLALPHISHATLLLRFSCTSTRTSFYAIVVSLALPHMCHATLEKSAPICCHLQDDQEDGTDDDDDDGDGDGDVDDYYDDG